MKYFQPLLKGIKTPLKVFKVFFKQKTGWLDTPKILPYKGYGNESDVFIQGMVIEDKGLAKPKQKQWFWTNIVATIKRFTSDEIPNVTVKATFLDQVQTVETDEWGFFYFHFHVENKQNELTTKEWHTAHFELLDDVIENQPKIYATGEVRIVPKTQSHIIVSDIDDTVMISHSTQTLKKLRLMLLKNAHTRLPFEGVAEFYQDLAGVSGKTGCNPFFYVSSSEWNLYDLLDDFFKFNHIPKGVLLLRKLKNSIFKFWKSGGGSHEHKFEKIEKLLLFYPEPKFILIGDSGQHDPDIYSRLALKFPGRVEAIIIRKIRKRSFLLLNDTVDDYLLDVGTRYYEVANTGEAVLAAANHGLIDKIVIEENTAESNSNEKRGSSLETAVPRT